MSGRLAVLAVTVALTACTPSSVDLGSDTSSTTSSTATTGVTETTPTADEPTTTTTSTIDTTTTSGPAPDTTPACPGSPSAAVGSSSAEVEVDGDGLPDQAVAIESGGWLLEVRFGGAGAATTSVDTDLAAIPAVRVLGGADIDGDGGDEVWLRIGATASAELAGVYAVDDCAVRLLTIGGDAAYVAVGGTVGNVSGAECDLDQRTLTIYEASSTDGERYEGRSRTHRLEPDGNFVEIAQASLSFSVGDDEFGRYSALRCGPVALGA